MYDNCYFFFSFFSCCITTSHFFCVLPMSNRCILRHSKQTALHYSLSAAQTLILMSECSVFSLSTSYQKYSISAMWQSIMLRSERHGLEITTYRECKWYRVFFIFESPQLFQNCLFWLNLTVDCEWARQFWTQKLVAVALHHLAEHSFCKSGT